MAEYKRGLPEGFKLDVTPVSDLGDYFDEPPPSPRPVRKAVETPSEPVRPVVTASAPPKPAAVTPEPVVAPVPISPRFPAAAIVPPQMNDDATEREERGGRPKAPRREISMTPETLRMSDELLDILRSGSGQRDTKASELFHALVLLVHEVKDTLDPHALPKRGRWGTPTARAYPLELKNAFLRALLGERQADSTAS